MTNGVFPIGRWDNVRIEDGKLLADPVFDTEDENARKIAGKGGAWFLEDGINWISRSGNIGRSDEGATRAETAYCHQVAIKGSVNCRYRG